MRFERISIYVFTLFRFYLQRLELCSNREREEKEEERREKNEVRWKSVCFSRAESRILRSRDIRLHVLPEIGRKIGWKKWKEKTTWKNGCSRFVSNAGRFFFSCRTRKLLASLGFWRRETIKGKMEEKDGGRGERMERETFVFIDRKNGKSLMSPASSTIREIRMKLRRRKERETESPPEL